MTSGGVEVSGSFEVATFLDRFVLLQSIEGNFRLIMDEGLLPSIPSAARTSVSILILSLIDARSLTMVFPFRYSPMPWCKCASPRSQSSASCFVAEALVAFSADSAIF